MKFVQAFKLVVKKKKTNEINKQTKKAPHAKLKPVNFSGKMLLKC